MYAWMYTPATPHTQTLVGDSPIFSVSWNNLWHVGKSKATAVTWNASLAFRKLTVILYMHTEQVSEVILLQAVLCSHSETVLWKFMQLRKADSEV